MGVTNREAGAAAASVLVSTQVTCMLPGLKAVEHVCVLGTGRAAWFRDPEGKILCVHEDLG